MADPIKRFNFDTLFDLALNRTEPIAEIEFCKRILYVKEPNLISQANRMRLVLSQGKLQDFYAPIAKLQEEEGVEAATKLATKLLMANEGMYDASIEYLEAICEMEPGSAQQLIDEHIERVGQDRPLTSQQIEVIGPLFISQAVQLIREIVKEAQKRGEEALEEFTSPKPNLLALPQMELTTLETNSRKPKAIAAKS